jgi:PHD/YefM family antitoxin component YafN of YafNO toxin-antitoxin module
MDKILYHFKSTHAERQACEIIQPDKIDQLPEGPCPKIVRIMGKERKPLVITQNGEAKAVMPDMESYEQTQGTLALLKILALGSRQIEAGKVESAAAVIQRLREQWSDR